ncbi:MAG: hypothetical protein JAY96_21430 [Candidatus Thiodiazotropha endolucinida]|nr:hypothetical protein [Candidatus Thiodiazotropha taylori]MCW4250756.1 hypothetical protein [Candidatus Thiodiazotropha endolucinida]
MNPPEELSIQLPAIPNMSSPNSIAEFVSMSFIYSGFGSLIRLFINSPTSTGRAVSPTVQNKLLSMMNLELGNTLEYVLTGDTDQRLKALVRLKGEALSDCEKPTIPV